MCRPSLKKKYQTLSIAVAASCIENAQNLQLASILAGQIARAAAVFNVDEVVVFDDVSTAHSSNISPAAALFARVLQFMETPQYLKKALIPMHPDLKFAGVLPPMDAPHHLRATEWGSFREGTIRLSSKEAGSFVDVGLELDAHIEQCVQPNIRVTLRMGEKPNIICIENRQVYKAELSTPTTPKEENGLYWGYITRIAHSLEAVIHGCPFPGGEYDLKLGTSEHGERTPIAKLEFPKYKHCLIAFGGPQGLEAALKTDAILSGRHESPAELTDRYLNTCFDQGSRTIRTEEAVLISLAFLKPAL